MGLFNLFTNRSSYTLILPSKKKVKVSGSENSIEEFVDLMKKVFDQHVHEWIGSPMFCRCFHSDPKRFQLMCSLCGQWIDVDHFEYQLYLANEEHREYQRDRELEALKPNVYFLGDPEDLEGLGEV